MLRLFAALLVLTCAVPASAQDGYEPFRPLHVGNEWVYSVDYFEGDTEYECVNEPLPEITSYSKVRILGDTMLAGAEARIAECVQFDPTGSSILASEEFVISLSAESPNGGGECARFFGPPGGAYHPDPSPVNIGGVIYGQDQVGAMMSWSTGGPFGFYGEVKYEHIGHAQTAQGDANPSGCYVRRWHLEYAVIDVEVFGDASPVTAEEAPAEAEPAVFRAYPTPTSTAVTLAGATGEVAVFDLLGRRVAQAESAPSQALRLDVSAWPVGLYVARVLTDRGPQTTRFVVAR